MGATYASSVVFGSGLEAVRAACARPAYLAGLDEAIAVFARADDEFQPTADQLSVQLPGAVVWSVSVFDSDQLSFSVYVDGREIATGTATPGMPPPPDADAFVAAIGRGDPGTIRSIFESDEVFAEDWHAKLCTAVGVDQRVAGCGYRYLAADQQPWRPGELEHLF